MRDFTVVRNVRREDGTMDTIRFHVRAVNGPTAIKLVDEAKARMESERGYDTMPSHTTRPALFHRPHVPTV